MSKDLNQCNFIGRLGRDVEIKYTASGSAIANISLACSDDYKDKNSGEMVSKTNWVKVVMFGRLAEIAGQYLTKGSQVFISGKFTTRSWDADDGTKRYVSEIVASEMQMLGGRGSSDMQSGQGGGGTYKPGSNADVAPVPDDDFDSIPF